MQRLKKGDLVRVISGKHKGSEGPISLIDIKKNNAIVEGVNFVTKHKKATQENQESGIIKIASPIHLSNLGFIDEKWKGATSKISYKKNKQGKKTRFTRKSGTEVGKK